MEKALLVLSALGSKRKANKLMKIIIQQGALVKNDLDGKIIVTFYGLTTRESENLSSEIRMIFGSSKVGFVTNEVITQAYIAC